MRVFPGELGWEGRQGGCLGRARKVAGYSLDQDGSCKGPGKGLVVVQGCGPGQRETRPGCWDPVKAEGAWWEGGG